MVGVFVRRPLDVLDPGWGGMGNVAFESSKWSEIVVEGGRTFMTTRRKEEYGATELHRKKRQEEKRIMTPSRNNLCALGKL